MTLTTLNGSMYSGHRVSLCRVLGRLTALAELHSYGNAFSIFSYGLETTIKLFEYAQSTPVRLP